MVKSLYVFTVADFAFMGALILEQVIKDLIPRGLKHATKLILTGSRWVHSSCNQANINLIKTRSEVKIRSGIQLFYPTMSLLVLK